VFKKLQQKIENFIDSKLLDQKLHDELMEMDEVRLHRRFERIATLYHFDKTKENNSKLYTCQIVMRKRGLTPQDLLAVRDANEVTEELIKSGGQE